MSNYASNCAGVLTIVARAAESTVQFSLHKKLCVKSPFQRGAPDLGERSPVAAIVGFPPRPS
jgi:hypothetical protein